MEYKVFVKSSELVHSETKEVLGVRYLFKLVVKDIVNDYKLLHVDVCLGEENNLVINFCNKANYAVRKAIPIFMRLKNGMYVSNNEYGVVYPNFTQELKDMLVAVGKKEVELVKMLSLKENSQQDNCNLMMGILKKKGIEFYQRDVKRDLIGELSIRFLGGFRAWSGDEDICDADILNRNVLEKIMSAERTFNATSTLFNVSFVTGEKAWTYFYFDAK